MYSHVNHADIENLHELISRVFVYANLLGMTQQEVEQHNNLVKENSTGWDALENNLS